MSVSSRYWSKINIVQILIHNSIAASRKTDPAVEESAKSFLENERGDMTDSQLMLRSLEVTFRTGNGKGQSGQCVCVCFLFKRFV